MLTLQMCYWKLSVKLESFILSCYTISKKSTNTNSLLV